MPHRGEHALDRICNRYEMLGADVLLRSPDRGVWCDHPAQMDLVLSGEIEEREQRRTILDQALDRRLVFGAILLDKVVNGGLGSCPVGAR